MVKALLARPWLLPLGILLAAILFFGASALFTTCDTKQPGELSRQAERRVKAKLTNSLTTARADSARARQAYAHAQAALDSANVYRDSLAYYQNHETNIIRLAASDTTRLQQLWSDVFGH